MAARASTRNSKGAKDAADGLPDLLQALHAGVDEDAQVNQPQGVLMESPAEISSEEARQLSEVRRQEEARLQEEKEAKRQELSDEKHRQSEERRRQSEERRRQSEERRRQRDEMRERRFLETKQYVTDYFQWYRRGDGRRWNKEDRRSEWLRIRHPRSGRWQRFDEEKNKKLWSMSLRQRMGFSFKPPPREGERPEDPSKPTARAGVNEMARKVAPTRLRFKRVLGYGGNGVAALFEVASRVTGRRFQFVVKSTLQQDNIGIRSEKSWQRALARARHIVQRRSLDGIHSTLLEGVPPVTAADYERVNDDDRLLLSEFMELGDLGKWIAKMSRTDEQPSIRALWHILKCLLQACIAMEYPPAYDGDPTAPLIDETVPEPQRKCSNFVHFDLDALNVFVSATDPEHQHAMPIFKLADFGVAAHAKHEVMSDDFWIWGSRRRGKMGCFAPEQFCEEWDYYDRNPYKEYGPAEPWTAGNYGPHTNVWAMGMVMQCIITKLWPDVPPTPALFDYKAGDVEYKFWSYASQLIRGNYEYHPDVSRNLYCMICSMMAHDPADRPTLLDIQNQVNFELLDNTEDEAGETDESTKEWSDRFFGEPPAWTWTPGEGEDSIKPFPNDPDEVS